MLLPIGDDNRDRQTTPILTYTLIAINVIVFVALQGLGQDYQFTYSFSTVPAEILSGKDIVTQDRAYRDPTSGSTYVVPGLGATPISVYITLITSMFMHGGLAHIIGNMLYLFIFGDNLEDRLGRIRFLMFYLLCGIIASLAHVFSTNLLGGDLYIPSLGASGAISGVLAGYLVLFPRKRVLVIMFRILTRVRAVFAIGLWFVFQLINGLGIFGGQTGGVAYAAHIGGFIVGAILILPFASGTDGNRASPPQPPRRRR